MSGPVVIVGAALAGLRTAEAIRRSGLDAEIVVVGDEPHLPYNRPPLSKALLAGRATPGELAFPLREAVADVDWRTGTRAIGLDIRHRIVRTTRGELRYGTLVIATGVGARRTAAIDEARSRHVVRTLDDAVALRAELVPGARVLVLGAGFLGCEIAATARSRGCDVIVVGRHPEPMQRVLGARLGRRMRERHEAAGVRFVHAPAARIDPRRPAIVLGDGTELVADVLVEATGSTPSTGWVDAERLEPGAAVRTDSSMRVLDRRGEVIERVYAVGDVAAFPCALDGGRPRQVEHWNMPAETARRAAATIAARAEGPRSLEASRAGGFSPVPSFWTDQHDIHLLGYGLPGLADRVRVLHGDPDADVVYGYLRGDTLVGLCGIGFRSQLLDDRALIGTRMPALEAAR